MMYLPRLHPLIAFSSLLLFSCLQKPCVLTSADLTPTEAPTLPSTNSVQESPVRSNGSMPNLGSIYSTPGIDFRATMMEESKAVFKSWIDRGGRTRLDVKLVYSERVLSRLGLPANATICPKENEGNHKHEKNPVGQGKRHCQRYCHLLRWSRGEYRTDCFFGQKP